MPGVPAELIPFLKELYAFRSFSDRDLNKVASAAEVVDLDTDDQILVPAGEGAPFYMIVSGRISLAQDRGGGNIVKDSFQRKAGQFFGADWVLYSRNRRLIATAVSPAKLLEINEANLVELLQTIPQFRDGLLFAERMVNWLRNKAFNWIGEGELVYLIARKHLFFLFIQLIPPILGMLGAFLMLGASAVVAISSFSVVLLWIGLAIFGLSALWTVWRYIDWGNDFYVVTDQRIVWIEQVLGMYESRREAFLSSIRNKQVRTANWFERRFGYGDITMTVYAGQIVFKNVPEPYEVSRLIDLLLQRAEMRVQKQNVDETKKLLDEKIEDVGKILRQEVEPMQPPPPPPAAQPGRPMLPSLKDILAYFRIETRFEQGQTITYRTHILFLIAKLFLPLLSQATILFLAAWAIWARTAGQTMVPTVLTTIVLAITLSIFTTGWILYHFADWRNDIYQITPNQVLDKDHKPFQEETVIQAFLNDIMSMEIERENLLEMMFNFGTVIINSGTDQKLTFDNIPNPTMALQDIYNRLFTVRRTQELADMRKQADQAAVMLATYHHHYGGDRSRQT